MDFKDFLGLLQRSEQAAREMDEDDHFELRTFSGGVTPSGTGADVSEIIGQPEGNVLQRAKNTKLSVTRDEISLTGFLTRGEAKYPYEIRISGGYYLKISEYFPHDQVWRFTQSYGLYPEMNYMPSEGPVFEIMQEKLGREIKMLDGKPYSQLGWKPFWAQESRLDYEALRLYAQLELECVDRDQIGETGISIDHGQRWSASGRISRMNFSYTAHGPVQGVEFSHPKLEEVIFFADNFISS